MEQKSTVIQSCQQVIDCGKRVNCELEPGDEQYGKAHADLTGLLLYADHAIAVLRQSQTEFKAETSATAEKAEGLTGDFAGFWQAFQVCLKNYMLDCGA